MRTIAITGSASGIGRAVCSRLRERSERVIGIDLRDAEIEADLAETEGRSKALTRLAEACGGRLDGFVACAGLGPQYEPKVRIVSVNYFGAAEMLSGVRALLARGAQPAAVLLSSNSATISPGIDGPLVVACLEGIESRARELAQEMHGASVYGAAKLAITRFMRRSAPSAEWAGAGIRLNAVAPGPVLTPLLQGGLDDPVLGPAIRGLPVPLGGFAAPEQIAAAVDFLLGPESLFCSGSVLFADGGTDALVRSDRF